MTKRLFISLALTLAVIDAVKFSVIGVDAGFSQAPWGFLLVFVVPFVAGPVLVGHHPRTGAVVSGMFAAVLAAICLVIIVVGQIEPFFMDYVVVYLGGPVAVALTVVAAKVLLRPTATASTGTVGAEVGR